MLTLTVLLIMAIVLSLAGKKGQKLEFSADEIDFSGRKPDQKDLLRVELTMRRRKKIKTLATMAIVVLALLIDWRTGGNPFASVGAQGHGHGRSPGLVTFPGWQAGGVEIPPQGFSGHMLVRFESGEASGGGFMIVMPGETRKFGWRVAGSDAPSCVLRIEFKGAQTHETGTSGGYSFLKEDFGEGEHEASFTAWCPRGRNNAEFQFATMTTNRENLSAPTPSWRPANGADIRHRPPPRS